MAKKEVRKFFERLSVNLRLIFFPPQPYACESSDDDKDSATGISVANKSVVTGTKSGTQTDETKQQEDELDQGMQGSWTIC